MRFSLHLSCTLLLLLVVGCSACRSSQDRRIEAVAPPPASLAPPAEAPPAEDLLAAELATVGWDALSGSPVVLLREIASGQVLPIWIGIAEARSIGLALHGIDPPRPMTHDLMADLLGQLDATLEEVVVTELRDSTYYGLLKLRVAGEDEPRWVDTRPSDGLALALRTGARILVAAQLIEDQPDFQFLAPELPDQVVRAAGLTVRAATPDLREQFGLPERSGLVVIAASGEAARRGLERGDLVVDLNGTAPTEPLDLLDAIAESPGVITVTYWRGGEETTVELVIETEPAAPREGGKIA